MDHLIKDLTLLLIVSLPINIFFHKIKLPSVMGFLIAGILIGPNGLHIISEYQSVEQLAEIGVILLLFVIGLEFPLSHMLKNLARIVGVGAFQVGLTGLVVFLIAKHMAGMQETLAIALALLAALSSTAIVLKMITDQAEIDTAHGRICIGVLLFQDLCVVPMMLIIPLLAGAAESSAFDFGFALLKSFAAVGAVFFISRLVVPRMLGLIARTGSKEHLTLFVILIILGTAWVFHSLGFSLAVGAFIAGLIISDSEYSHQIVLDILPLKDYFGSIFFISIGMLLQTQTFIDSLFWYLGLTAAVIALKALLAFLSSIVLGNSFRISFVVGLRLAQVGEFSLLLADLVLDRGLFTPDQYQSFLIVSILTMLVAPILIQLSSVLSFRLHSKLGRAPADEPEPSDQESVAGHVIVAGYGLGGRNLARVLKEINIPFLILELDGERIKQALTEGMRALYGDATHREVLLRARIKQARMIVFSISDYRATEQAVRLARKLNPELHIMVRTRSASHVEELTAVGATQVIPEEFETSIEIFSRVLREFHIANNIIEQQVELIRMEGYSMFRGLSLNMESLKKFSTYLTASLTESFHVLEDSWCNDKFLHEIDLDSKTGVQLIAVVRGKEVQANPDKDFRFKQGDIIVLFGRHAPLDYSIKLLQSGS